MPWVEIFVVFIVCHLVGDFLLQTDWQALNKRGGLGGDPVARRALASHLTAYGLAFVPAFIWIGIERDPAVAVLAAVLVLVPHLIQDDGRLVRAYVARAKGLEPKPGGLMVAVDQSFHVVAMFAAALIVAG